jgi:dolichyl-phosphate beta-glucosyltransferase
MTERGRPGSPDLSLIIPAYNEAGRIRSTLEATGAYLEARDLRFEVLVCADGTDGTRELAGEVARTDARVTVLGGPRRGGKGRAIYDLVLMFDVIEHLLDPHAALRRVQAALKVRGP